MNNDVAFEQPVVLPGSCCLITSVPLSLTQGCTSWLLEVRIWVFFWVSVSLKETTLLFLQSEQWEGSGNPLILQKTTTVNWDF